jgi:hypothetical protein
MNSFKLSTIQKRNNLNEVFAEGEIGPGGAYHTYRIQRDDKGYLMNHGIQFQKGPCGAGDSESGILDVDLLEIVRHRLQSFQAGEFSCRENALALTAVEEALLWMNKRVEDRAERGVLGTNNK